MVFMSTFYVLVYIVVIISGLISTIGWIKSDNRSDALREENEELKDAIATCREAYSKVKAENNFYKRCAEEQKWIKL